jgi:hypothetical protein
MSAKVNAVQYQIATDYGPEKLAVKVNELMALGWTPVGGVAVEPRNDGMDALYSQALTKLAWNKD